MQPTREPIIEFLRCAMHPTPPGTPRVDDPAHQVLIRAVTADMDDGGNQRTLLLAIGTAMAASGLVAVLADHRGLPEADFLDQFQAGLYRETPLSEPADTTVISLIRALLTADGNELPEMLARLWVTDQEAFLDLIIELGAFSAEMIGFLDTHGYSTTEETFHDLDELLLTFVGA